MDESVKNTDAVATEAQEHFIDKMLKVIAFPVAAFAGFITAKTNIHTAAYELEKRLGTFDDVLSDLTPLSKKNSAARVSGNIEAKEYLHQAWEIKDSFSKAIDGRLQHMGLGHINTEWKHVNRNQRLTAVINALTVSGVTIGALLTIADNRWLSRHFLKDKENKENVRE